MSELKDINPFEGLDARDILTIRGDAKTLLLLDAVEIVEDVCPYACKDRVKDDDCPPDLPCQTCLLAERMRAEIAKEVPLEENTCYRETQ